VWVWLLRLFLAPAFLLRAWLRRIGGDGQKAVPLREAPGRSGPVAVLAMYQDGALRADIRTLAHELRDRGVYVIAVNTGRLADGGAALPVDCYIERRNFGRDFGSYRLGLVTACRIVPSPSRVMLLNDSVYYARRGLPGFIERLLSSPADVCSATESREVVPHQTSFCMSFSPNCVASPVFAQFWRRYRPSELRPLVVMLGEVRLSRCLQAAGFSREVLASHDRIRQLVTHDPELALGAEERSEVAWCLDGNVTHRAPRALLDLGVPLVKLDLVQRTRVLAPELDRLSADLPMSEAGELRRLLMARAGAAVGILDRLGRRCGFS